MYFQIDQVVRWSDGVDTYIFNGKLEVDKSKSDEEMNEIAQNWFDDYINSVKAEAEATKSKPLYDVEQTITIKSVVVK